jgi:hypothetical protein
MPSFTPPSSRDCREVGKGQQKEGRELEDRSMGLSHIISDLREFWF